MRLCGTARSPAWLGVVLLLGGCASVFPEAALRAVDRSITVTALRQDPQAFIGRTVMVGGDVLATRPMPGVTEVELLAKPLDGVGRPRRGDDSEGRVIVKASEFLDPAVYDGRRLTVIGTVAGEEERKIGELPYRYPVITAISLHLWPREPPVAVPPWPYYYEPWPYFYPWPAPYGWRHRVWGPWPYWW